VSLREDLINNEYQNKKSIVDIDLMSGIEFEEFLCNYFKNHGYECSMTKASADQGLT
jgi:HJR/Mrr/RecB family endonuclease